LQGINSFGKVEFRKVIFNVSQIRDLPC